MSNKGSVAALREQMETLFPGKWFSQAGSQRTVLTGLTQIDHGISHGLTRRRIAEWVGHESSGKTTVLRSVISNWCANGFYVVYIDALNRLLASDWAFVDKSNDHLKQDPDTSKNQQMNLFAQSTNKKGKFLVVRNLKEQDVLWSTEQLVRSNIFDVVVLESGSPRGLNSRTFARLQRALDRSKTVFMLVRDEQVSGEQGNTTWGCDSRFKFEWSHEIQYATGLTGTVAIRPNIQGTVWRDGLSQEMEINGSPQVPNHLFTHQQVPDRRIPKSRTGTSACELSPTPK